MLYYLNKNQEKKLGLIKVGKNCKIGAGAVVISDIPDNKIAKGIPAKF